MSSGSLLKYQDSTALNFELSWNDRELFALGRLPGFTEVEVLDNGSYKERICLTTICRRESDDTFWMLMWSEDAECETTEGNDYGVDSLIHRVSPISRRTASTSQIVDWIKVKKLA